MKFPKPIGLIKVPKEKSYPDSIVVRAKGSCMDSPEAEKRVKDGDYLLIHPISIEQSIGKVVVLNLQTIFYTKQVVKITPSCMIVRCFKPYLSDITIPISDIIEIYSVDDVISNIDIGKHEKVLF